MKADNININLTKDQKKKLISYLDMAFEDAVNKQLPLTQDGIKDMIKYIRSKK
jgi:hypothetical protein